MTILGSQDSEAKSRQEQVLLLAAEGLTDKEIAIKLNLSPETVGTYWRRILARHSAASRTEVVAKIIRSQSLIAMRELQEISASLQQVTDFLLSTQGAGNAAGLHALLGSLPEALIQLNEAGQIVYFNRNLAGFHGALGDPFEGLLPVHQRVHFRHALDRLATGGEPPRFLATFGKQDFEACVSLCAHGSHRSFLVTLRPV